MLFIYLFPAIMLQIANHLRLWRIKGAVLGGKHT